MWERAFVVLPLRDVAPELNLIAQLKAVAAQPITVLN
jgi:7,8-dihydro-6-hydroxymethylpterin-pyrophosphokinase